MNQYDTYLANVNGFREDLLEQLGTKLYIIYKGVLLFRSELLTIDPSKSKIMRLYSIISQTKGFSKIYKTINGIKTEGSVRVFCNFTENGNLFSYEIETFQEQGIVIFEKENVFNHVEDYYHRNLQKQQLCNN